jgi:equilibrative nucleoside transporter 1/2/3
MSLHSPKALYHPIPQAPVAANPAVLPDPDGDAEESQDDATSASDVADSLLVQVVVDSRIRAIHFVLGCAVLLPWNGRPEARLVSSSLLIWQMK